MKRTLGITVSAVLVGISMASSAHAASLFLTGVSPAASMNISFPGVSYESTPYVGAINWSFDRNNAGNAILDSLVSGSTLTTFCIEGTQNVYLQQTANFSTILDNPALAPKDNVGSAYSMGLANSAKLSQFWDAYYGISGLNAVNSAAFQMGIWEIVYDGGVNANFGTGGFKATSVLNDATSSAALNQSANWLANLGAVNPSTHYQLYVLSDPNLQDQLFGVPASGSIPSTPLPAALPAGAALLGGLGLIRKWKTRKSC